jgi:hypothetical protein
LNLEIYFKNSKKIRCSADESDDDAYYDDKAVPEYEDIFQGYSKNFAFDYGLDEEKFFEADMRIKKALLKKGKARFE